MTIDEGDAPDTLPGAVDVGPMMRVSGDALLLDAPVARYLVRGGGKVIVAARPGASALDVRLYLLGVVMGALCHQRGLLALHATAVGLGDHAVVIAGPSGAGKSTLAAMLRDRGRTVLADDLCAIGLDAAGAPMALPGLARIKLWPDSLKMIGLASDSLARVAEGVDKFSLAVHGPEPDRPTPLWAIYCLRPTTTDRVEIRPLSGAEAVSAIIGAIYRWPLAAAMGRASALFAQGLDLAKRRPVFEVVYAHDPRLPLTLLEALEKSWSAGGDRWRAACK